MEWAYTDFVWPFAISVLVSVALLRYAWPRRRAQAALPLILLTALAGLWSLLSSLQVLAVGLEAKVFFAGLRYVPIVTLPVAWLTLALAYSGRRRWLAPRYLVALLAVPLATLALVASGGLHGLMFEETALSTAGPVPSVARAYGPWFWIHAAYSYALIAAGAVLIVVHRLYVPKFYRRQATLILVGAVAPLVVNVVFLAAPGRFAHIDPTPIAFTLSGVFFAWGLFRFHLLDVMPAARAAIIESLPDAVVVLDVRHRVVDLNPAACRIFGEAAREAVGMPVGVLTREMDLAWPEQAVTEVLSQEVVLVVAGERRYFDWSMAPLHHRHGWTTGRMVVVVLRDITDRKRATLLEAGQKRVLEMIADGTPLPAVLGGLARFAEDVSTGELLCAISLLDEDGKRLRHGAAPSLPAAYTQALDGVEIGACAGVCGTAAYLGEAVAAPDIATDARWASYRDLALRHGLRACRATPIFSSAGQVLGTFAMYYRHAGRPSPNDVRVIEMATYLAGIAIERRRFEAALIQAKEEAEEMARLKSSFLANMSHEIRTPLTSIIGFADILAAQLETEHQELVGHISKGGQRLLDTLNSVLDYARLEAGKVEIRAEVLDVSEVARETVAFFLPQTRVRGIALHLDDRAQGALALLDRSLLIRVLNNLLENALKFTEAGYVVLRVCADEARVALQVQDTGCGISEAFLPLIFDEFRQESTGMTRKHEGSGLGLKITRHLVEQMHGTITVESRKGEGSTFTVTFPRLHPQRPPEAGAAARPPAPWDAQTHRNGAGTT